MGARLTGKTGAVKVGGTIVASLDNWDINTKLDTVDSTAFSDIWHQLLATFIGWSGSVSGKWEAGGTNDAFWLAVISGAYVSLDLYPDIGTTEKYTGNAFCDFNIKVAHNGVVTFTAAVTGTGTLVRTP